VSTLAVIYKTDNLINGIGQMNSLVNNRTNTTIKSRYSNYKAEMSYFVIDSITGILYS